MFHYWQGLFTKQGHKGIPDRHFEEEQGRRGFFGAVSHLIKNKPSTRWVQIDGPLKPQLFDLVRLKDKKPPGWQRLFFNKDCVLNYCFHSKSNLALIDKSKKLSLEAFKNADADTLYFCHLGSGQFLTEYGALRYRAGSYILIPKCVAHYVVSEEDSEFLIIESKTGAYREPDRGMLGRNAFYDSAAFGLPDLELRNQIMQESANCSVDSMLVKRGGDLTRFVFESCIFQDTVGWKGDLYPLTLHVSDLMPVLSHRVHLPPSAHTTFVAPGFVVCTFCPRPLESDADALKVPFYHQNIDYDEILFYHAGNFFSRDNLHAGMLSFHPAGFPHGPHPKAVEGVKNKTHTDEYAVMIDTWSNLEVDEALGGIEVKNYWQSWMASK